MPATKRSLRVFLCHASEDKGSVHKLYEYLTQRGVDAWLDQKKLVPGQDWQVEIPEAVRNSDIVIVCLSKNSLNKEGYVQKEIRFALDFALEKPERTIFIIPARLEACDVPQQLRHFQWVDLFSEDGYQRLLKALQIRANDVGAVISRRRNKKTLLSTQPIHLVTNLEYLAFVQSSKYHKPLHWRPSYPYFPDDQGDVPVTLVSWDDAMAYCDWVGGRLPTTDDESLRGDIPVPVDRTSEVGEWRDLGDEQQKQIYSPYSSHLIAMTNREKSFQNVGFRCLPVQPTSSVKRTIIIEGGSYQLGTDIENVVQVADAYRLDLVLRQPILRRQAGLYKVPNFRISVTCVTNEEYFRFTQASGKKWPGHWNAKWLNRSNYPFPARLASRPVMNVRAEDAQAYCIWSKTRLPNWFEWERAASGPARQPYPWGIDYNATCCNSMESGRGSLAAVDEYPLGDSPEGVRQLCGNLAEWVVGPNGLFELRGGSYLLPCELWGLAYVFRQPELGFYARDVGFRVVID